MDQIMIFDKSYQQRLQEYIDILSSREVLPVSQVKKEWSYYLELVVDPNGWQAIWKIPRMACEKYKIAYPTIVLVYIDSIDPNDLTALVKILAVQDEIHLPDTHVANLTQLWPTTQQDDTVCLNMSATANALDMYRFFYNHLWMPWDTEEDDDSDWISKHLAARLRLYYDMKQGVIPRKTAENFRSMVIEARSIQQRLERLEEDLSDSEYTDVDTKNVLSENLETLTDLHIKLAKLKTEVEIIENPVMRSYLLKKQKSHEDKSSQNQEFWLVFKSGSNLKKYMDYIENVKDIFPVDTQFKTATSVQNALDFASPNDEIILGAGKHHIKSTCALEEGGVLKGLPESASKTIIESSNEDIMLDFSGENILLENLSINAGTVQCGIIVRSGLVKMKNCCLTGAGESSTQQGLLILTGSELVMEDCQISGFSTGIFASLYSKITLKNCTASNMGTAFKIFDDNTVTLIGCHFNNCKEYAIYMETESDIGDKMKIGDISLLQSMANITAENCSFAGNAKGNVIITKKSDIFPVRDLFSNPTFNTTLMKIPYEEENDVDEEMQS